MTRPAPSLEAIGANPTLLPVAFGLVQERFPALKWHSHADSPDSSQAFALSAFLPLLTFADKDDILERFVTDALPAIPPRADRTWHHIIPEFARAELLGETGQGMPTNIDILLEAADVVVCIESKFRVDAMEGFGACGHATSEACRGFHGPHSDTRGGSAWCRLEAKDGRRDPRRYWELGRGQFRKEALAEQTSSQVCPFRDTYQLMRNYLTAAELARREDKPYFGALGIVPERRAHALSAGVRRFKNNVLLPEHSDRVAAVMYEDYIGVLEEASSDAKALADFLHALL